MQCEKCGTHSANVHLTQTINGETKDMYLCSACANDVGAGLSFGNLFQGFLESFFGAQTGFNYENKPETPQAPALKCASCGLTYENFKKSGKLGCAECYKAFRGELSVIIKNIQGSNIHAGKVPKRGGESFIKQREIDMLKAKLKKAIESEEYEEAARIRDEIRTL